MAMHANSPLIDDQTIVWSKCPPALFRWEVLRQHLDLGRQSALVEQEAFEALDELIALGDLLPLLFEV
jgi:hypothetical protein